MQKERSVYLRGSWVRHNIKYGLVMGPSIGMLLSVFRSLIAGYMISPRSIVFNVLFSTFISLSITNTIYIGQKLLKLRQENVWQFVTIYYLSSIIGMVIGVEISYLIVSFIFDVPYVLFGHPQDLLASCFIVLIICTVIYTYHGQRERMNARLRESELDMSKLNQLKTEAELQALQSKINPHFLYNALNSIAGLIHEDADKAEDMTLKLSRLFRYSMNSKHENFATVADELEAVRTYFDIEVVRFGDRIRFDIDADPALLMERIPRFIIQPLVENSLKHGLNHLAKDGKLGVKILSAAQHIVLEVSDNGIPFPEELTAGYGLQSTYDKLKLLYQEDYEVQLLNRPAKMVRIVIPKLVP